MYRIRQIIIPTYILMVLGACQADKGIDDPTPPPAEKMAMRISTTIAGNTTEEHFDEGDEIGLFVVNRRSDGSAEALKATGNYIDNRRYTYHGTWAADAPTYWKDDDTHADFYVYHPYTASLATVEARPWSVATDQSQAASYKASDLLIGQALDVAPSQTAVGIAAKHAMSQMLITLAAGNGVTQAALSGAEVRVCGLRTQATANLQTGSIAATGQQADITPMKDGSSYKALVVPQAIGSGTLISVKADGREYRLDKTERLSVVEPGKRYQLTVTLSKTSSGVDVTITQWDDDGTDYGGTAE